MRRRQGTGTIERRKQRDGSIRFMPRLPDADRTPLGTFPTYEEAAGILEGAVYRLTEGRLSTSKTLGAYGLTVLDRRELDGYRSVDDERTRWKYVTGNPEKNREPWACASWPIASVKRKDVLEWTRQLKKLGLSHSTRVNALNLLRTVFAHALDDELLEHNPAADVRIKDHGRSEETMRPLTLDELAALFWAADDEGRKLIAIAVWTGIRSSELRALRHVDVFLEDARPHLRICHGKPGKPPKNGKVRRVPLFGAGLEAMCVWTPPANDRGLFFATSPQSSRKESLGCVRRPGEIVPRKRWRKWLAAAGIDRRVRWHDLRHTCATLLLQGELDGHSWSLEELRDLLGHSSITVTERYAKHLNRLAEHAARRSHTEATRQKVRALSTEEESRLRDLNSRPTVYEGEIKAKAFAIFEIARGLAVEVLRYAADGGAVSRHAVELAGELLNEVERAPSGHQKTG